MSKAFQSIKQGLLEAIAHQEGRQTGVRVHAPPAVDVKEIRRRTGLTPDTTGKLCRQEVAASKVLSKIARLRYGYCAPAQLA